MAILRALCIRVNQGRNINPSKLDWKAAELQSALIGAHLPRASLRGTVYPFPLVAASYNSSACLN